MPIVFVPECLLMKNWTDTFGQTPWADVRTLRKWCVCVNYLMPMDILIFLVLVDYLVHANSWYFFFFLTLGTLPILILCNFWVLMEKIGKSILPERNDYWDGYRNVLILKQLAKYHNFHNLLSQALRMSRSSWMVFLVTWHSLTIYEKKKKLNPISIPSASPYCWIQTFFK